MKDKIAAVYAIEHQINGNVKNNKELNVLFNSVLLQNRLCSLKNIACFT